MTTTTTSDTSSLKTPASLSGGDLVSRLLAATPPYLYNVPLTPHSFFFSEMLRSFVQAKAEAASTSAANPPSAPRRRKRSWRDARERPLELTTKDKSHLHLHNHHHHHHNQQQQQKEKYFQVQQTQQQQQQQQQSHQESHIENRFKNHNDAMNYSSEIKNHHSTNYEQKSGGFVGETLKTVDDNCADFRKDNRSYFDDSSRHVGNEQSVQQDAIFSSANQKVKPEEQPNEGERKNCNYTERNACEERSKMTNQELSFLADQKNKFDYAARNFLPAVAGTRAEELQQAAKGFGLSGNVTNSDFLPAGPLWYPPYPSMAQSYPGIDPLHFFIDLRVSGHIWDRKLNERQLPFKSKHCSAFSVPQTKEYNRPLNLTRDEAATSSTSSSSSSSRNNNGTKNLHGTHFILRNLTETYKDIREMEKNSSANETSGSKSPNSEDNSHKDCAVKNWSKNDTSRSSTSRENQQQDEAGDGKDIRALIGLELVVDYVKEPKEDPAVDEEPSSVVGE